MATESNFEPPDIQSREVSFRATLDRIASTLERLEQHGIPPMIGSHTWLELPAGDPLFVGAVYRAALLWTLHVDESQEIMIASSKAVAAERDWTLVSRHLRDRADAAKSGAYIERKQVS
ncbi:DUF2742 domain-containing protein [Gordonia sp. CPCC 205333]|uniref:DUF2742 domain-containing protein n=1 Tax=Gordonia sp. CPCC 205333 TaxID=3140790 RepID=UPI003AF37C65